MSMFPTKHVDCSDFVNKAASFLSQPLALQQEAAGTVTFGAQSLDVSILEDAERRISVVGHTHSCPSGDQSLEPACNQPS